MESDDPEVDEKENVCPICDRSFSTMAGLRQHWTKSHSEEEILEAIANKTNSNSQLPPPPQTTCTSWNKFQIISVEAAGSSDKLFQQFDIIETTTSGDCLFSAVMKFMSEPTYKINNIPLNVTDLRTRAVDFIMANDDGASNFSRFKDSIAINLQHQIPELSTHDTDESIGRAMYSSYMYTPGNYGTTAELCAMAELFGFGFYVVRENGPGNYTCIDYGSFDSGNDKPALHLLFTGDISRGHFRLLQPTDRRHRLQIELGDYGLVSEYTSSKITSIAHERHKASLVGELPEQTDTDSRCDKEKEEAFEDFVLLLARCKRNIRVLKRVPRGARIMAATKLTKCIQDCLAEPHLDSKWKKLLTFAYATLRVPESVKNKSLASMVKKNIEKSELIFPKPTTKRKPISMSKRVEYKIAEGNVKGAVKILSSADTLVPQNAATFQLLQEKHPAPTREMNFPEPPDKDTQPLVVTEKEVFLSTKSFPNGSAAGIDGILPQHLKDLTLPSTGEAGLKLIKAAKLSCASVRSERSSKFAPRQVGFGVSGGCEAAAHATRTFIKRNTNRKAVVLKIDFRNAFNEVDRDVFLAEMKANCPAIYPFLWQCYSTSTLLFYGDYILLSQNGAQQGDPCGPLLFSSAIQSVVAALTSEFIVFYLDDGTIAGEYDNVLRDFKKVIDECGKMGLRINPDKCEIFFCSEVDQDTVNRFQDLSPGICVVNELTLLGAPISDNAAIKVFKKKLKELKLLFRRLDELDSYHIAFYILRNCFSLPKLVFLLRTTPTWKCKDLMEDFDNLIKLTVESLTNCKFDLDKWTLASLPINCGGLGIRGVQDAGLPAFLSSVHSVSSLVSFMFNSPAVNLDEVADYQDALNEWNCLHPETELPVQPSYQKQWSSITDAKLLNGLQIEGRDEKARLLAIQRPESGAWLHALPSKSIGTLIDNNAFLIIVGLRLGVEICVSHTCACGLRVDVKGRHGLKCRKSAGRHARHAELNNIIKRALLSADVPSLLEPVGLARNDGKRVDGMTLIPWSKGSSLVWDATCTDTFAPSNLAFSSARAGRAADDRAQRKTIKYSSLIDNNYLFVPFAVETMGSWGTEAQNFFNGLSKMIAFKTQEPRSRMFLMQRISIAIQRGNAAAVMGTFRSSDKMEEIFYLL